MGGTPINLHLIFEPTDTLYMQNLDFGTLLQGGRYKILHTLGRGGFGITYLAEDVARQNRVAIKEFFYKEHCERKADHSISVPLASNVPTVDRLKQHFLREAHTLKSIQHPNIVRVLELFEENQTAYYVMDYIEGRSLAEQLEGQAQPMTEEEVRPVLKQLQSALSYLHSKKVLHLDIKPSNIMCTSDGHIVLIDFGASKHVLSDDGKTRLSTIVPYTDGYAPFEQKSSEMNHLGPCTDIYALGATLYALVTKQTPPDPSEILNDSDDAFCFPASVSQRFRNQIMWMMEPSRNNRPQNVKDIDGEVPSRLPKVEDTDTQTVLKVKTPVEGESTHVVPPTPPQPPVPPQPRPNNLPIIIIAVTVVIVALIAVVGYVITHRPQVVQNPDGEGIEQQGHVVNPLLRNGGEMNPEDENVSEPAKAPANTYVNGHEAVDLGLSVKWATCNVGADSPYERGYHLDFYDKDNYIWGGWRVPSTSEVNELINNCTKHYENGGYRFTGPNGNSIFLVSGGYDNLDGETKNVGVYGDYWTANSSSNDNAYELSWTNSHGPRLNADNKLYSPCVRLVTQ